MGEWACHRCLPASLRLNFLPRAHRAVARPRRSVQQKRGALGCHWTGRYALRPNIPPGERHQVSFAYRRTTTGISRGRAAKRFSASSSPPGQFNRTEEGASCGPSAKRPGEKSVPARRELRLRPGECRSLYSCQPNLRGQRFAWRSTGCYSLSWTASHLCRFADWWSVAESWCQIAAN
jgi:hypothetical protein